MLDNPWWHGYYTSNYLAATLYASRIGDSIYNSVSMDWNDGLKNAKAPKALGTHTDAMKESVKKINWNVELAKIKQNYSLNEMPSEKKLMKDFFWGMAIHIATDSFAHSVRYNERYIHHDDADKPNVCRERNDDARYIAIKILDKHKKNKCLEVSDLVLPENLKPSTYKLIRIYGYLLELGEAKLANQAYSYSYHKGVK